MADSLERLTEEVVRCERCPRLVEWREREAELRRRNRLAEREQILATRDGEQPGA